MVHSFFVVFELLYRSKNYKFYTKVRFAIDKWRFKLYYKCMKCTTCDNTVSEHDTAMPKGGIYVINLDYRDKRPIFKQLEEQILEQIARGVYVADQALPSVRSMAVELGINPNTIQKAYRNLEQIGAIYSVAGRGSFVNNESSTAQILRTKKMAEMAAIVHEARMVGVPKEDVIELCEKEYSDKEEG